MPLSTSQHRHLLLLSPNTPHVLGAPTNMSNSSDHDRGCAVRPDGTLKDASEIDWEFDPDGADLAAIPNSSTMAAPSSGAPLKIHPFFAGQAPPTINLAGSRRSARSTRPSARAIDPDNAMNAPAKRKASGPAPKRCVSRKIIAERPEPQSDGESYDENYSEPARDATDVEESDGLEAGEYDSLKTMADADHQVCIHSVIQSIILIITL
jgi:hypothetical protein